eukprot:TRINITY_DN96354_c0_g1_i1.p1 TRINITY_DN96354_c0_g1~~TRINITY_DN96354_c0_g1_i1.p1  ORF type:complete len:413 (-),score=58.43 TRINITY_DN96354_c0_g1_i1:143-1312(-)
MALQASGERMEVFEPSYEWGAVPQKVCIPPGLEVKLSLQSGGARMARIPSYWRLLVVSAPGDDACRLDVSRTMRLAEVQKLILRELGLGAGKKVVSVLRADSCDVAGGLAGDHCWTQTVEESRLFGRRVTCVIRPAACAQVKVSVESASQQPALEPVKQAEAKSKSSCENSHTDSGLRTCSEIYNVLLAKSVDQDPLLPCQAAASVSDERKPKCAKVSFHGVTFVQHTTRCLAPPCRLRRKTKDVWTLPGSKPGHVQLLPQTKPACVDYLRRRRRSWLPRKLADAAKTAEPEISPSFPHELLLPIRRRRTSFLQRKVADIAMSKCDKSFVSMSVGKSEKMRRRRSSWLPRKIAELTGLSELSELSREISMYKVSPKLPAQRYSLQKHCF